MHGPEVTADTIILSAGSLESPALLMRSGVGPGADLAALAIPVVADRRGVGRNLMEHPSIAVSAYLRREGRERHLQEHHEQAGEHAERQARKCGVVRASTGLSEGVHHQLVEVRQQLAQLEK